MDGLPGLQLAKAHGTLDPYHPVERNTIGVTQNSYVSCALCLIFSFTYSTEPFVLELDGLN